MAATPDPAGTDTPPPRAEQLERLPADVWASVLTHARAALHALEADLVDKRMERLRATPTSKLAGGRSRRDLCELLAEGGALWRATADRLAEDADAPDPDGLAVAGTPREAPASPPQPSQSRAGDEVARLRERARGFKEQRDEAMRRAEGLEARLGVEQRRTTELSGEVERLRREGEELRGRLEAAAAEREQSLDRLRRRHETERAADREELRQLRRELQREQRREERGSRAEERLAERVREEVAAYQSERRRARVGRPSTLPPGTAPDTTEAVQSLLDPGRRVLVDGYNVTKQHRGHLDLEQQRLWLVRLLEAFAARTGVASTVVFDAQEGIGTGAASASRQVRTVFSEGSTADDHLVEMVAALDEDEPVVVVTDDRELGERLRALRADVVPTRPFLEVAE